MSNVQRAIIPGMIMGCLFVIYFTNLLTDPARVLALAEVTAARSLLPIVGEVLPPEGAQAAAEQSPTALPATVEASEAAAEENAPAENEASDPGGPAECAVSAAYPEAILRWCEPVSRYAAQYGIDPDLVSAVMLQESGGNPDAYSRSGAVGLMQVMPRDGLAASFVCKNGPCFASRPSMEELYDPEFNISYGARMLAGLINRLGSEREALRSYGPMDMGYRYADIVLSIYNRYR